MSVDVVKIVSTLGGAVISGQLLESQTAYQASSNQTFGMLLLLAGISLDGAADRLATENAALEALLGEGADVVADSDAALARSLRETAASPAADLKLSTLQARNDQLRAQLIDLHAAVEDLDTPAASRLDDAIWQELAASTERRRIPGSPL